MSEKSKENDKSEEFDKRKLHKGSPLGSKKNSIDRGHQPEEEFIQPKANESENKD